MIKFIDYDERYHNDLMMLQINQWGANSDSDDVINNIFNYKTKLVIDDNLELIGTLIFHPENDNCIFIDMIIIKPNYQKMGIGTKLLKYLINYAKKNNFKIIEAEAIETNGNINAKKLLENFGFVLLKTEKNYWGKLYPNFHCKECGNKPCTCSMLKYMKNI